MSVITILNLFLLPCLIVILLIGAILNYKYVEKNVYQKYLISTLVFWAVIMIFVYVKFFADGTTTISYTRDVCSVQVLLLGIPCFFTLISYPVVILNAQFLTLKRWFKAVKPMSIAVGVYFGYHLIAGENPLVKYTSYEELFANITTPSVILRIALLSVFIYYSWRDLRRIWRVVPLYNQYVQDNIADSECNVGWIRRLTIYISITMLSYFALLLFSSPYVNCIYILTVIHLFFYIVEMSLLRHTSAKIEQLEIMQDVNNPKGYVFVVANAPLPTLSNDSEALLPKIDKWIEEKSPYANIDFTTNDIIEAFPELTHQTLTALFRSRGVTFQNYVRRFRIIKACQIIDNEAGHTYPQQTYAMVGFSHHSSFSRAFVALVGMSPSEYAKLSKEDRVIALAKV